MSLGYHVVNLPVEEMLSIRDVEVSGILLNTRITELWFCDTHLVATEQRMRQQLI